MLGAGYGARPLTKKEQEQNEKAKVALGKLIKLTEARTAALETSTAAAGATAPNAVGTTGGGAKHRADELDLRPLARNSANQIMYPGEVETSFTAIGRKMKALPAYPGEAGPAAPSGRGGSHDHRRSSNRSANDADSGNSSDDGDSDNDDDDDDDDDGDGDDNNFDESISPFGGSGAHSSTAYSVGTLPGGASSARAKLTFSTIANLARLQSQKTKEEKARKKKKEKEKDIILNIGDLERGHTGAGGKVQFQLDGSYIDDQGWALQIVDDHRVFDPHLQTMREWAAALSRMKFSCKALATPTTSVRDALSGGTVPSSSSLSSEPPSRRASAGSASSRPTSTSTSRPHTSKSRKAAAAAGRVADVAEIEDYGLAEAYKTKFKRFWNGSGIVYWPSGNKAIVISSTKAGPYVSAYADGGTGGDMLRFIATPLGHGAVYRDDGSTHLSYSPHGISLYSLNGSEEAVWPWGSAPFIMPIEIEVGLSVLCGTSAGVELHMQRQAQSYNVNVMPQHAKLTKAKPAGVPPSQVEFQAKSVCKDVVDRMNAAIKETYSALHTVWLHTDEIHQLEASRPPSAARQKLNPHHHAEAVSPPHGSYSPPASSSPPPQTDFGGSIGGDGDGNGHVAIINSNGVAGVGAAGTAPDTAPLAPRRSLSIANPGDIKSRLPGFKAAVHAKVTGKKLHSRVPDVPQPAAFVAYSRELANSYHAGAYYARNVAASGQDKLSETLTAWSFRTNKDRGKGGTPSGEVADRPKSAYTRKHEKALAEAKHRAIGKHLLAAPALIRAHCNPDKLIPSSRVAPGSRKEEGSKLLLHHDFNNVAGGGGDGDSSHTHSHYSLTKLMAQSAGRPKTSRPSTSRPSTSRKPSRSSSGSVGGHGDGMHRPQTAPAGFGRPSRSSSGSVGSKKDSPRSTVCVSKLSAPNTGNQHMPCHCDPRQIPTLSDGGFDKFIKRAPKSALIAVLVTERSTAAAATEEVLLKVYTDTAGSNIFPCTTFPDADVIVVKAFAKIKVKGKAGITPGLIATRHRAETGMVLFYGGGSMVHAKRDTRPLRGAEDFNALLKQARTNLVAGRVLPNDFQF